MSKKRHPPVVRCGGGLLWWMSSVVDVWCGGCLCGGCRTILFLHTVCGGFLVWWMSSVVDVWCGGFRSIDSNLHVPLSTTADPLAHAVQDVWTTFLLLLSLTLHLILFIVVHPNSLHLLFSATSPTNPSLARCPVYSSRKNESFCLSDSRLIVSLK